MPSSCLLLVLFTSIHGLPLDVVPGSEPGRAGAIPLGSVYFHPTTLQIEIDGHFNMTGGFVEFLACLPSVRPHETLISIDIDPADLQGALLLMGLEKARRPLSNYDLEQLDGGDRVVISLRYPVRDADGQQWVRTIRAENCLINAPMAREMARCGFAFTGSGFEMLEPPPGAPEGTPAREEFMARVTGEIVALCHRPWSILDNPLALPFPDGDYFAYTDVLPAAQRDDPVPVTMLIHRAREAEIDEDALRMELPEPDEPGGETSEPQPLDPERLDLDENPGAAGSPSGEESSPHDSEGEPVIPEDLETAPVADQGTQESPIPLTWPGVMLTVVAVSLLLQLWRRVKSVRKG